MVSPGSGRLNFGELCNLADLDVWVDEEFGTVPEGMLAIVDAECELVCFCPADKAALMVRTINTYIADSSNA